MSDLDRFELFTQVVKSGGISQAAQALDISKAAVSKQIKHLEQTVNTLLFTRYKQRLQLTPQGEALFTQCLRLQRELNEARNICQAFDAEPTGDLHVVVFVYFAQQLIFPRLKQFLATYPKLNLRIDTTERVPDFINEQIDLAIGFSLPVPNAGEVIQQRMATTRYVLCASPDYFTENGIPKDLNDLAKHRYIEHTSRSSTQTLKLKPQYQVIVTPYLLLNSVNAMIDCARQGIGLVQLPFYMVKTLLNNGELIEVLKDYQAVDAGVYYHYLKQRYMQPKIRKFIDYFLLKERND